MSTKSGGRSQGAGIRRGLKAPGAGKQVEFLHKPNCTTCRKTRSYMEKRGYQLHFRDLAKQRLSSEELDKLIGNRDYREFLNARNERYRNENMKNNPPSREQAIQLMTEEPNLIRRPVIVAGGRVVLGFDEKGIAQI